MALLLENIASLFHRDSQSDQTNVKPLDKKNAAKLFTLYQRFFDQNLVPDMAWMRDGFSSLDSCSFPWQDLHVAISPTEIEEILKRTGVLQLRPIPEDFRILVVGCGNGPIADSGCRPLAPKSVNEPESESYRQMHNHVRAITINPHLGFNPTLVAFFGSQRFPMLKTGQFDLIVLEGTKISDTPIGRDELNRLLSATGRVVFNYGDKKGFEFSWEENRRNVWVEDFKPPAVVIEDLNIYESFNYSTETN